MKRPGPLPAARPQRPRREPERAQPEAAAGQTGAGDDELVGGGVSGFQRFSAKPAAPADPVVEPDRVPEPDDAPRGLLRFSRRRAERDDAPDAADEATSGRDEAEQAEGDDPVRWSDVWRAGRARRKALRSEARRFTARTRKRRWYWLGSLGAVLALVIGTLAAAYSPLFAVRDIQVVGAQSLDAADIADALSGEVGSPMPLVDHSAIREALLEFPLIETYQVESHPPHQLVVRIVERTPVGAIKSKAGYTIVDAAGVALSTQKGKPDDQPVISVAGGTGTDAFVAIGQVLRSLPESLKEQVTKVTATTSQDVTLVLGDDAAEVVWGSADESAMKALVLSRVMDARPIDETSVYDVSSPTAVVVR